MRPEPSCSVAKLALPMTRLSTIRPAIVASVFRGSSSSFVFDLYFSCKSKAISFRRKSFGKAMPRARRALSFSRRSSISLFSSSIFLDTLFQAGGDEFVQVAVEHLLRGAFLDPGAQVLDAGLVQDVGADLVPPLDIGLRSFQLA